MDVPFTLHSIIPLVVFPFIEKDPYHEVLARRRRSHRRTGRCLVLYVHENRYVSFGA